MRHLARLLIEIKKIDKDVVFIADALVPGNFHTVIKAVKYMCCFLR